MDPLLMTTDIEHLRSGCERLYHTMQDEALLEPLEPYLRVAIRPVDRLGHLAVHVKITPDNLTQRHEFEFEIDQSHLPTIVEQCQAILREYPIVGQ